MPTAWTPVRHKSKLSIASDYVNVAQFFPGAIETLGLTPLTDYLAKFGGWPMTLKNWDESKFDWKTTTASALTTFDLHILISVFNDLDSNNTDASSIYVDQDSLYLPRSVLANPVDNPEITTAYKTLIVESARAIRSWLKSDVTDAQIKADVDAILKFESQLAMVFGQMCCLLPDGIAFPYSL